MNKKALVIPILLLTFALISIPVMSAPATKVEGVTATLVFTPVPGPRHLVDHYIQHVREGTSTGTVSLTIPELGTLEGTLYGEWKGKVKFDSFPPPDPNAEGLIWSKHVWTFTGEDTTGTFEGVAHSKWIGFPPPRSYIEWHMVLQGTGDFEGQTLRLSYEGAPPEVLEGYLIIPK